MENAARIGPADAGVAGHEFFAGIEIERIPVLAWCAAFGHRVKADDRPVGEVRFEAVFEIFCHAGAEGLHLLVEGWRARSELFLVLERGGVFRITGRVFAALGHREPAKGRREDVWPEGGRKTLGEGVGNLKIGREQHEAEVGFWRDHAEEEELGAGGRADFANQFGKGGLGGDASGFVEEFPSGILYAEEEMEDMAALDGQDFRWCLHFQDLEKIFDQAQKTVAIRWAGNQFATSIHQINMADAANKYSDNVEGKFFVDDQCIDCDLCRETAPANFKRNDDGGHSYVYKQPETPEEEALSQEAMDGCPVEAIGNDG